MRLCWPPGSTPGAYNASKGAVVNLTRAMALDAGRDGVRVNSVCPTVTWTAMSKAVEADEQLMSRLVERIPLGRIAEPADIAAAITFLASDDARFITGVNLPVDGGLPLRRTDATAGPAYRP